ncbi:MAG TPA: STAS domain-containing protein [Candidatus Eremiobacteraceae bacterium]|nr:STAS domain-containing protein [Candidatus Eremiobacteraceae bacterium]
MQLYRDVARAAFVRQPIGDDEYIHVFGEIDTETDADFRQTIAEAARSAKRVVIDFSRCTYVGSQGFGVLFDAKKLTDLAVIAPARIRRLMGIVGLSSLLIGPHTD